jgi:hypothetical protein
MGKIIDSTKDASKNLKMANYMLTTTYPLLNEPKVLMSINNHVLSSFMSSISALLAFERSNKNIPPYHNTTESKINCFKQHIVKKYKFENYLVVIEKMMTVNKEHEKASIAFTRDNKYVICSDQFEKIESLSKDDVKKFISNAKEFLEKIEGVVHE